MQLTISLSFIIDLKLSSINAFFSDNVSFSGIFDTTCGRMYSEYHISLPGGFRLPVCLAVETIVSRSCSTETLSQDAANQMLTAFAKEYVSQQMIAGTIQSESHFISESNDVWTLDSSYLCNEMIGRIKAERNGEWNE